MHPEDRVLVAILTSPRDFELVRHEGWYRIPQKRMPQGVLAEYLALYFNRAFGDQKWAVHYYGRIMGHELARRRDLFPAELDHPRADDLYYKVQLGPLQQLQRPIISLRWRRISFIHTTWDRFVDASEINDLYVEGEPYVDRLFYALHEAGIYPEREYRIGEGRTFYVVDMMVPCQGGLLPIVVGEQEGPPDALYLSSEQVTDDPAGCARVIRERIEQYGGVQNEPEDG